MPVSRRITQPQTAIGKRFAQLMKEEDEAERLAKKGQELEAAKDAFIVGFTRNKKRNLWRRVTVRNGGADFEVTCTVFLFKGAFRVCIADKLGPHYGEVGYDSENDALIAIWWALRSKYPQGELV